MQFGVGVSVGVLVLLMVSYLWYCILTAVPICNTIDFELPVVCDVLVPARLPRLVEAADARRVERPANEPAKLPNEPANEPLPRGRVYSSSEP